MTRPATAPTPQTATPAATPSRQRSTGYPVYVVQPPRHGQHETLWSIAEQHLGDPLRWHEIAALNLGRTQPDGRRMTDPHWIRPGWELLLPADAVVPSPPSAR